MNPEVIPARLMGLREYESETIEGIIGFVKSEQATDGIAVSLILVREGRKIEVEFAPHLPPSCPSVPKRPVVTIGTYTVGAIARMSYGTGYVTATLTEDLLKNL